MSDTASIKQLARELGFALCGVAPAAATAHREHVLAWLAAGQHGTMEYLARNLEVRLDPAQLVPGARSIICVADFIGPRGDDEREAIAPGHGRVARYAQVDDYHRLIKDRLHAMCDRLAAEHPQHAFRACVDTAPILEREQAMRAGIGWTGKNTLLIHPRIGSHLLLGEIVTTLPLEPDAPEPDHCGTCTRCIDACPTSAITPYTVDGGRCISYLTIEHRGPIDPAFHAPIGDWLYGCDICQDVCPYNNRRAPERPATPAGYGARPAALAVLEVLGWTEEDRRTAFTRSAMKRAKLEMMKRNALIVAGNRLAEHSDETLLRRVRELAADASEPALVRETAAAVLARLNQRQPR